MKNNFYLSICVPALNEENSLKASVDDLISVLSSHLFCLEIIVVNDGSSDATADIAEKLAKTYSQVRTIHHKTNLGIGVCYCHALSVAKGDYFTWFPGDHENSVEEFIQCLPHLKDNTVVTCHHRTHGYDSRSMRRRLISHLYTGIMNRCFNLNLKYYNGLSVFPTAVLRLSPLAAKGFFIFVESLIRSIKNGAAVVELAIPLCRRQWGKTKALSIPSLMCMGKDIFRFFKSLRKDCVYEIIPLRAQVK